MFSVQLIFCFQVQVTGHVFPLTRFHFVICERGKENFNLSVVQGLAISYVKFVSFLLFAFLFFILLPINSQQRLCSKVQP